MQSLAKHIETVDREGLLSYWQEASFDNDDNIVAKWCRSSEVLSVKKLSSTEYRILYEDKKTGDEQALGKISRTNLEDELFGFLRDLEE